MIVTHPNRGDKRTTTKFLLFSLRIGQETRWLETATFEEEFKECYPDEDQWVAIRWMEK